MNNELLYMTLGRRMLSFFELMTKGTSSIKEASLSNRTLAYRLALQRFFESPLFGKGIGSFSAYSLTSQLNRYGFCPSNYLELLQGVGLLGTIPFYVAYLLPLIQACRDYRRRLGEGSILIILLVTLMLAEHTMVVFYYQKLEYLYLAIIIVMAARAREVGILGSLRKAEKRK
jgi:O-antigen ligase